MQKLLNDNNNIIIKIINLILQNNIFFDKDFSLSLENKSKEILFLNNKRNLSIPDIENNDNLIFKKEFGLCQKKLQTLKNNPNMINVLKLANKKNSFVNSQLIISENKNENNSIFNSIESINKSNKISNIIFDKNYQLIDKTINKTIKENEDFNKEISLFEKKNFNNEVRVKDNNKIVYINSYLGKSKILNKNKKNGGKKRSSKYRGVSKNGNKWQAIMHSKNNKAYISTYSSEEDAARIYDIMSIKARGLKAKTNFKYNINQIKNIFETEIDIKSTNINEIISTLIK